MMMNTASVSMGEAALIAAAAVSSLGPALGRSGRPIQPDYNRKKQKKRLVANRIAKASRKRNRSKR